MTAMMRQMQTINARKRDVWKLKQPLNTGLVFPGNLQINFNRLKHKEI